MDLIIGAGVSGISYANFTKNDFIVIEKESELGGYCRTIKRNGYVWDYSGHFFHFRDSEIEKTVCKNISPKALVQVEKHTQILYNGKYIDFPFQKNIHQLKKEELIDCLYDLFNVSDGENYSTFKEMIYAKFGKSIAEKFLIPYNEKLYACNLDILDMDAMGRFFPKADKEEIILNFKATNNTSYNSHFTYPKEGAIEYISSLVKNIDSDKIFIEEELQSIDVNNKIAFTTKREIRYDNLISTLPFPILLDKCSVEYPQDIFTCNKVLVFNLGFDSKGDDIINNWIYMPNKDFIFYRIGYYDNIIGGDRMSLYVEIGFPEKAELKDNSYYLERILTDLKKAGIISSQKLIDYETVLMNPAYVHINKKSTEALNKYKQLLAANNIYSIGRYGSWTYCSIEDNIIEARSLAHSMRRII
ncbi:NAD(P)-binding protein [uncultured Parabacteroides sp.]|jgi:protoporphyrinogen oxidase|uniref:protoporphyrinogen/coproporphyrinogen oxidase n=1 Tax=uncultured Parabacteroides sp. TaxID=512312 RepID=UPI0025DEDB58|nr:NAD(P)-binding protein [uncultured Parabacteroides sp.]